MNQLNYKNRDQITLTSLLNVEKNRYFVRNIKKMFLVSVIVFFFFLQLNPNQKSEALYSCKCHIDLAPD